MYGYLPRAGVFACDKRQLWATKTNHQPVINNETFGQVTSRKYVQYDKERKASWLLALWGGGGGGGEREALVQETSNLAEYEWNLS